VRCIRREWWEGIERGVGVRSGDDAVGGHACSCVHTASATRAAR
jgi:hypothetical protein